MKRLLIALTLILSGIQLQAQTFEWSEKQDNIMAGMGQTIRVPIRLKNTSDKAQIFIIRKALSDLGAQQKGYFCMGDDCFDASVDQVTRKLEAGESLQNLYFAIETGFITGQNSLKFEVIPKSNPGQVQEHTVSLSIEEKAAKAFIFQSKEITVNDIYPNPVVDQAFIDYRIHSESMKAKVVIHNILGSAVGAYEMPFLENRVKIQAEELTSGVYFYTVYVDNIGVLTRKLVVRK